MSTLKCEICSKMGMFKIYPQIFKDNIKKPQMWEIDTISNKAGASTSHHKVAGRMMTGIGATKLAIVSISHNHGFYPMT